MDAVTLTALIESVVSAISEHFDAIQVIGTHYDSESKETKKFSWGYGNWHARRGACEEWLSEVIDYNRGRLYAEAQVDEEGDLSG